VRYKIKKFPLQKLVLGNNFILHIVIWISVWVENGAIPGGRWWPDDEGAGALAEQQCGGALQGSRGRASGAALQAGKFPVTVENMLFIGFLFSTVPNTVPAKFIAIIYADLSNLIIFSDWHVFEASEQCN
jgi:hypothetical protein